MHRTWILAIHWLARINFHSVVEHFSHASDYIFSWNLACCDSKMILAQHTPFSMPFNFLCYSFVVHLLIQYEYMCYTTDMYVLNQPDVYIYIHLNQYDFAPLVSKIKYSGGKKNHHFHTNWLACFIGQYQQRAWCLYA